MRIAPLFLTLSVSFLTSATALAYEPEAQFFWSNCIAFGEFQGGAYSSENGLTASERYAARESDETFQYVLTTVREKIDVTSDGLIRFHKQIDVDGAEYEKYYILLTPRMGYSSRQDMIVTDLCMY